MPISSISTTGLDQENFKCYLFFQMMIFYLKQMINALNRPTVKLSGVILTVQKYYKKDKDDTVAAKLMKK